MTDVVIIGAGLSGLIAARHLTAAGVAVTVLEADMAPGGRVRTDVADGFRFDRGFQVTCPAYPAMAREFDVAALRLKPFVRGVGILEHGRVRQLRADPTHAATSLVSRVVSISDVIALSALSARDVVGSPGRIKHRDDRPTLDELRSAGVSPQIVDRVLRPFLSGVFLEDQLETSGRFFHLMWRAFLRGGAAVPALGMQAMPDQLAADLAVHYGARVAEIGADGVTTDDGRRFDAPTVLVATDATNAEALLGVIAPGWHGVTTFYHATRSLTGVEPLLRLDPHGGVLTNSAPISAAAPDYAPPGSTLVATSVLGVPEDLPAVEGQVRQRIAALYGTSEWDLLRTSAVPHALPTMTAPHSLRRDVRVAPGRYVCGDHRSTSSIQGALANGRYAAKTILADLKVGAARG
jgi:phytoene dehydrogenase-like protein